MRRIADLTPGSARTDAKDAAVIAAWPAPADLRQAGAEGVDAVLKTHGARRHASWAAQIVSTLDKQTVVVAGTDAAGVVPPRLARQPIALHVQRHDVAAQVEALVEAHPPHTAPLATRARGRGQDRRSAPRRDPRQILRLWGAPGLPAPA